MDGAATELRITARWGRYVRVDNPKYDPSRKRQRKKAWRRIPIEATSAPMPLVAGKFESWSPDPKNEEVTVRGLIRHHNNHWTITVYLTNEQTEPKGRSDEGRDSAWVFQPELIIEAPNQAPLFLLPIIEVHSI